MLEKFKTFMRDEEGASAVEYGLNIGLIAVALVLVLSQLGGGLNPLFTTVKNCLTPRVRP